MSDEPMPTGKITQFDKGQYERLIGFVNHWQTEADTRMTTPATAIDADERFDAGSEQWPRASEVMSAVHAFAGGIHDGTKAISADLHEFVGNLKSVKDVFEDTDDLATLEASKFSFGSGGYGGGTGGSGTGTGGPGTGTK